jgi:DNA-directed RNA polymerase alpha subunit
LNKAGIATVNDLIRRTATELRAVPNFGKASLKEVREKLAVRELSLNGP